MKNLAKLLTLLLVFTGMNCFAQKSDFPASVLLGLEQCKKAENSEDAAKVATYFESIAKTATKEWTPSYYAAYCNLYAGLLTTDKAVKDQYWDKALLEIDQADAISANNSEIYALKGYLQFMKMSISPMSRMNYMTESAESMEKAAAINPENPRVYLIKGQDIYYTPEAYGGGPAKAKSLLETAVSKFATFKPVKAVDPNWGADLAVKLVAKCN